MFWENTAGDESFAVQGSPAATLNNVSFVNNTFHCALGEYLYEDALSEVRRNKRSLDRGQATSRTPKM